MRKNGNLSKKFKTRVTWTSKRNEQANEAKPWHFYKETKDYSYFQGMWDRKEKAKQRHVQGKMNGTKRKILKIEIILRKEEKYFLKI